MAADDVTPGRVALSPELPAAEVISLLDLRPHPEGGYFRETFRDERTDADGRAASTAIYFLLTAARASHWHRIDAVEIWHYYAGAPLRLLVSDGTLTQDLRLGPDLLAGEQPQAIVAAGAWQFAGTLGEWTLVGCTVAPGFEYEHFELAPEDWAPGS